VSKKGQGEKGGAISIKVWRGRRWVSHESPTGGRKEICEVGGGGTQEEEELREGKGD